MSRKRRLILVVAMGIGSLWSAAFFGNSIAIFFESDGTSTSIGTPSNGSLIDGKHLPTSGSNFRAYSRIAATLGRNTVHSSVRDVVLEAYANLDADGVGHTFVYGEASRPGGGPLPPHRTHQNGLSVDFMVPVLNDEGAPVVFPASWTNKFGYNLEFDAKGCTNHLTIDFAAISDHLLALEKAAAVRGMSIKLVVFAPEYREHLMDKTGRRLDERMPFLKGSAWVRHDEHYHVDFGLPPADGVGRLTKAMKLLDPCYAACCASVAPGPAAYGTR